MFYSSGSSTTWTEFEGLHTQVLPDQGLNTWPPDHGKFISCPQHACLNHCAIRDLYSLLGYLDYVQIRLDQKTLLYFYLTERNFV